MTNICNTEQSKRDELTHQIKERLLSILACGLHSKIRMNAAKLIKYFISTSDGYLLEPYIKNPQENRWVRTFLLRALSHQSCPLTDAVFTGLLTEFRQMKENQFACFEEFRTMMSLAGSASQRNALCSFADDLPISISRPLLLSLTKHNDNFNDPLTKRLYSRVFDTSRLDDTLIYATIHYPRSQMALLNKSSVDYFKLGRALTHLSDDEIIRLFNNHPTHFKNACRQFAVPPSVLKQSQDDTALAAFALDAIESDNLGLKEGKPIRRHWFPALAIEQLDSAADILDSLLSDPVLEPAIRHTCALARLHVSPPPRFEALPENAISQTLKHASTRPISAYRDLYQWAADSPTMTFKQAGLRGLLHLDGCLLQSKKKMYSTHSPSLTDLLIMEGAARHFDVEAVAHLKQAAAHAPHVVLRAQALRSLRKANVSADDIFLQSLHEDNDVFQTYYAPAKSEAALALSSSGTVPVEKALLALVEAALTLSNDDAWWGISYALASWFGETSRDIAPVWYWHYAESLD